MTNQYFSMVAGDSKNLIVSVTEDGNTVNLDGSTAKWVLKKKKDSPENEVYKDISSGISVGGNQLTIRLDPEDTETLYGGFYHECELTDAIGNVSTIMSGTVTINKSGV